MSVWPAHPAADVFPPLDGPELDELAADIAANGLHEPVWLYDDPEVGTVILDGRNRARACQMAGVDVVTRVYTGDDPIAFSISQNLKRRHLTPGQKAAVGYAALDLYEVEAALRMLAGVASDPGAVLPQGSAAVESDSPRPRAPRARDKAAKATGSTGRAVAQFKRITEQAPDLAEQVKAGSIALDRAERIVRDRDAESRRIEQARQEAAELPQTYGVDIRHGDFREVLADLTGIDAIITDPPYPAEFLPLLDDLAAWADKILTPDGVLAVLIGQTHLPEVYRRLNGHRPYRWTACYLTPAQGYVSHPRKVQSNWKPLLVYGGGPRFADVIRSEGLDAAAKSLHKWGQDYSAFHTIVERLTERGQTVCDPFMGSGTTLLAARALGRHVIGCDNDESHVQTSRERVA